MSKEGVGATIYPPSVKSQVDPWERRGKSVSPLTPLSLSLSYFFPPHFILSFFLVSIFPSISLSVYHSASVAEGHGSSSGGGLAAVREKHRIIVTTQLSQLVTVKGALVQ